MLTDFTFQYGSIKSAKIADVEKELQPLHSSMVLLNLKALKAVEQLT